MTKFKIGDKVVVLADSEGSQYHHCFSVGEVGIVIDVDNDSRSAGVEVLVNEMVQWLHPSELELVNE